MDDGKKKEGITLEKLKKIGSDLILYLLDNPCTAKVFAETGIKKHRNHGNFMEIVHKAQKRMGDAEILKLANEIEEDREFIEKATEALKKIIRDKRKRDSMKRVIKYQEEAEANSKNQKWLPGIG